MFLVPLQGSASHRRRLGHPDDFAISGRDFCGFFEKLRFAAHVLNYPIERLLRRVSTYPKVVPLVSEARLPRQGTRLSHLRRYGTRARELTQGQSAGRFAQLRDEHRQWDAAMQRYPADSISATHS
jgi:hypothetical protein